jgi:argininosuccinate lyase
MYRSRPKDDLEPEGLNFMTSFKLDNEIAGYDILGTQAHVIMLYENNLLTLDNLKKILSELLVLRRNPKKLAGRGYEDIHEALETHLVKKLGIEVGGRIQTGRSRNDQVILDTLMKARDGLNNISSRLVTLIEHMIQKAEENLDSVMPLYTHLQQAQIGNLAHYFLSYSEQLLRDLERLSMSYSSINKSPLGSGPVGGSSISIDRKRTASLLGFKGLVTNSIDATSSRDTILELMSALSILMVTLSRIAEDIIIWSTQEFGFMEIADKFASTSSAMPHKKNPDPLELIRSKATLVAGNLLTAITLLKGLPSGYSRDLQDLKAVFLNSMSIASSSLSITDAIIKSLIIHKRRMKQSVVNSYACSIDIAEQLVIKNKLPFRTAHRLSGSLVKLAIKKDMIPLSGLSKHEIEPIINEISSDIKVEELIKILMEITPEKSVLLRSTQGSPNPIRQKLAIKSLKVRAQKYSEKLDRRRKYLTDALDRLENVTSSYVKK